MCFSAGASFAAGVVISAVGVATVIGVHKPFQRLFALIPILLAIQQFAEGCLWVTLQGSDYETVKTICTYVFLITAQVIWPVMIPLSVLLMEEDSKRRKILRILLVAGMSLASFYSFYLLFSKATSEILNCHIMYIIITPKALELPTFAITVAPLFVSSVKRMYLMSILILLSLVVAVFFYKVQLTSVWCFFAALLSMIILWILRCDAREAKDEIKCALWPGWHNLQMLWCFCTIQEADQKAGAQVRCTQRLVRLPWHQMSCWRSYALSLSL